MPPLAALLLRPKPPSKLCLDSHYRLALHARHYVTFSCQAKI